jgi:threonine dehydratase
MTTGDAPGWSSPDAHAPADLIARADLAAARGAVLAGAERTPTLASAELSEAAGTQVALKAECLQATGSFKLRGALSKVAALGSRASAGLVTASASNHARAVAQAARLTGVGCEVFMPRDAPVSKVAAVERLGARGDRLGRQRRQRAARGAVAAS